MKGSSPPAVTTDQVGRSLGAVDWLGVTTMGCSSGGAAADVADPSNAAAPGVSVAPATVLYPNIAVALDEGHARVDHPPGPLARSGPAPAGRQPGPRRRRALSSGAAATLHVTRAGARFLGRGETATCIRLDTPTFDFDRNLPADPGPSAP